MSKYHHLFRRKEYPAERGYRMESVQLPDWIYLTISEENNSKYIIVHSKIHVNKEVKMPTSYSVSFTDNEIIKDQSANIYNRFL